MLTSYRLRLAAVLIMSFLGSSCAAPGVSTRPLPQQPDLALARPIHANIVLLMPDDFERYVNTNWLRGREIHLQLGRQAADLIGVLLRNNFDHVGFIAVRSEPEAIDMISSGAPEVQRYDLIAVPKFSRVDFWERGNEFGYEIGVSLEFYSPDSTRVETIGGRGESRTGIHSGFSPQQSAGLALANALDAVKDGLEMRRLSLSQGRR